MIQVIKDDNDCPTILKNQGKKQTEKDVRSFKRASKKAANKYATGERKFPNLKYYSNSTVKQALMKSHHSKCCYCEQWRRQSELAVEHFRPRSAVKQTKTGSLIYPGYYWLAYSWDNLFLSCAECNSRFKGSLFPLVDPSKRAFSDDDIIDEQPLLINPGLDDPREHVRFRVDQIYHMDDKGEKTIEVLNLDEENLRKAREEKIGILQTLLYIIQLAENNEEDSWNDKAQKARQELDKAILPQASFSSMAKDFLVHSGYLRN